MLEQLFKPTPAVIDQLKEDHRRVEALFKKYEGESGAAKRKTAQTILEELTRHAAIEERAVYPAIREVLEDEHLVNEAVEEHRLVTLLIRELKRTAMGPVFEAKLKVLKDLVQHHVKEEEDETFPAAEKEDLDWEALNRKAEQMRSGATKRRGGAKLRAA